MILRHLCLAALMASLAACAQLQKVGIVSKGYQALNEGVRQYNDGQYPAAARSLQGALDQGLSSREQAIAHKHLAFIHCSAGRERACRDEFRRALTADSGLELSAAERDNPAWGPIFRAAKAESGTLGVGLRQFNDGDYDAAAKSLQVALDRGLSNKDAVNAHKHLAFIHCASSREQACREEFRKALELDPALELTPAEAGHPVWGPIFRSLKAKK